MHFRFELALSRLTGDRGKEAFLIFSTSDALTSLRLESFSYLVKLHMVTNSIILWLIKISDNTTETSHEYRVIG